MAKRITFEFPDRSHERMIRLKEKTESRTYAEVVKNSLRLYEWIIAQTDADGEVYIRYKNGNTSLVPMFFDN